MPKTRVQKEEIVQVLTDKLSRARSVVFANYQGMSMSQLTDLRQKLSETSSEFTITKNNLLSLALKANDLDVDEKSLEGPVATLFAYEDEITPIKILVKALKDNQVGSVKSGLLNGETLEAFKVTSLANLPTKDELRAKVVGSLGAPLYGIVGVLNANIRNLVYALDQIRISKGGEA